MQSKKIISGILLLFGIAHTGLKAQESVNTTGKTASGSGGSASYSIGPLVYTTISGSNGSVSQGVQQPFEISIVTTIEEAKGINR